MLSVSELMTEDLFTLRASDTLRTARSLMNLARVRHIPIVDEKERFIGLVTHRDILGATVSKFAEVDPSVQREIDAGIPIMELMRTDVTTVAPDTPLRDVAQMLLEHKYGCLPVVEDEVLKGIITEADFLKLTISLMDALENEPEAT